MFRISSLNSVSVLLKIGSGLITSKVIALFVGPSGMALVGNMRNFVALFESISNLGFQNGIIRFVSAHQKEQDTLRSFFATVFYSVMFVALMLSGVLFLLASYWTGQVFQPNSIYEIVIKVFAITLPWQALSIVLISVLNGFGHYQKVIHTQIIGNLIGVVVTVVLITQLYTLGALLSIIITPAVLFGVSFYFLNKEFPIWKSLYLKDFKLKWIKELFSFTVMALFTAVISPLVYLFLRNHLIDMYGLNEAGQWEGMLRLSTYYMMLVSTLLTVYFLPRLAQSLTLNETGGVFLDYYKKVLPVFALLLIILFILRNFIISVLFSADFLKMGDLFMWQLIGDFFKAAAIILGYEFYAKKMVKAYLVTETVSFVSLVLLGWYFSMQSGAEGMVKAYAFTYIIYFMILIVYFRNPVLTAFKK